jgi:secondary thiamine-phosphate synthase enzyme
MEIVTTYLNLSTKGRTDIHDITSKVQQSVTKAKLSTGTATVFINGSTAGLTTIEYEPALVSDIKEMFESLIPSSTTYAHDRTWGDANGYSHLRASLLGPSITVPFVDGKLCLGTWQQIIFLDFDNRPRQRRLVVQVTGKQR